MVGFPPADNILCLDRSAWDDINSIYSLTSGSTVKVKSFALLTSNISGVVRKREILCEVENNFLLEP